MLWSKQCTIKQNKTKQTKQNKTKQNKTKQNKTKTNKQKNPLKIEVITVFDSENRNCTYGVG